jgi:tyrosine-protein kinase Etk/Wzc
MDKTYELAGLWDRIWVRRRGIGILVGVATLLTIIVALLLPPWYRAQTVLLPPTEEQSGFGIANLVRGLAMPGVRIPTEATPADVFMAILESRTVGEEVVRQFDLQGRYQRKHLGDAVQELRRHAKFKLAETGTIEISVEDHDARRAADMANAYVDLLDRFNREVRMTKGRRTRLFLEQRLAETREKLTRSEQVLTDYQAKHKAVALSTEMSSAIESAAQLSAQRMALQVRLGVMRSYSRGTSEEQQQVLEQLAQLDRQLQQLPSTGLEIARLLRDVKVQEQLYLLLTAQFEDARLAEARDVVTVEVLDRAVPPERRVRPKRSVMVAGALLLSLAVGVAWAVFQEEPRQAGARSDPTD